MTIAIFIDLTKAFDLIDHDILLKKLCIYGGSAYKLLESSLKNRQQYIDVNGVASTKKPINIGVPQRSILGPLFFFGFY